MLKVCLGDAEATHLLFQAAEDLARAEAPATVTRAFMAATMTGYDQVWPDQVWPNPSLARTSLAKTKFGQDQVWPRPSLAKLGLAKLGLGQTWSGQTWSWPNLVWPNLVLAKLGLMLWRRFIRDSLEWQTVSPTVEARLQLEGASENFMKWATAWTDRGLSDVLVGLS